MIHIKLHIYYGWIIVFVIALSGFAQSLSALNVLGGLFLKPMTEEFEWSRSLYSGAVTIGVVCGGILAIIIGPFMDRFGTRKLLVIAFLVLGLTTVLKSQIESVSQFYILQVIGQMFHTGIILLALNVVIPKWFIKKRGRAVAFGGQGIQLGNSIAPIFIQFLISLRGWRFATAISGITIWVLSLIPIALFMRRRPEDIGLLPDGNSYQEISVGEPIPLHKQEISLTLRKVITLPSFYLLVVAVAIGFFVTSTLDFHLIPFFTDRNVSPELAVATMAIVWISAWVGTFAFGFLSERLDTRIMLGLDFLCLATAFPLLLLVHSTIPGMIWGIYYGLMVGGMYTMQQIIIADYYGREFLGAVRGIVLPIFTTAGSFGPLVASLIFDSTGNYTAILIILGIISLISMVCAWSAHKPTNDTSTN